MPFDASTEPTSPDMRGGTHVAAMQTPLGRIALHWCGDGPAQAAASTGALTAVVLAADASDSAALPVPPRWLAAPFDAYFQGPSRRIDVRCNLSGTPFQRRVWRLIAAIPPGATRTYGELATALGSSARAVGGACRANPCPLVVPCHRVVARHGLGGFAGDRGGRLLDIKRWLLSHEAASARTGQAA
jgi:methylated-DNA-[protein]-cysteine S-methyltransferase